jgi:hypothetical protein
MRAHLLKCAFLPFIKTGVVSMQLSLIIRCFLIVFFFVLFLSGSATGQAFLNNRAWVEQLNLKGNLPEKLLSTRSVVFHSFTFSDKELKDAQEYFQRTGIDAVAFFDLDMLTAAKDFRRAFGDYLSKREITNLLFMEKLEDQYRLSVTSYNGKENVIDPQQSAWSVSDKVFSETLKALYRTAANQQKKQNLLINDVPEMDLSINPIVGKRNEFFAIDVKVDPLAVPKFGDETLDATLEELMKNNYPLKYKLTDPALTERELRKQGYLYVVCFVHTRGEVAKKLLGYDMSKSESALVSVTYPSTQQELKNIPSDAPIFKVYFKHIDSGNVFLGTKWDADLTWEQALLNHIRGLKVELRIN